MDFTGKRKVCFDNPAINWMLDKDSLRAVLPDRSYAVARWLVNNLVTLDMDRVLEHRRPVLSKRRIG
jgi:hypothetical protein